MPTAESKCFNLVPYLKVCSLQQITIFHLPLDTNLPVNGNIASSTNIERIMSVVSQFVCVARILVARCNNLSRLRCDIRLRS